MTELNVDNYAANIPKCCAYQTIEQHEDILLCWGLVRSIEQDKQHTCGWCELNTEHTREEYMAWWKEHNSKQKVWNILKGETL